MDPIPTEAFAIRAEINRTLRILMPDNPIDAEERAVDIPELRETDISGDGALEFTASDGRLTYIVYSRGTKYTTAVRPSHLPADKIRHVTPPAPTDQLWIRLQERCHALEQTSKDAYDQLGIGQALESVSYFYLPRKTKKERPIARFPQALTDLGNASDLRSDEAIKQWIAACTSRLIQLYASFLLAGDEVVQAYATLSFFQLCPFSPTVLINLSQSFFEERFGTAVLDKHIVSAFPIMDVKFYLGHPDIRPDLAIVWTTSAARVLQRKADELRDEAKTKYTAEEFSFNLYMALLYYRCALYLYYTALSSPHSSMVQGPRAVLRLEEAKPEMALCEEHRVLIVTSLMAISGTKQLSLPSIVNVLGFHEWIRQLAASSGQDAETSIRQAYASELAMPKFLRDLALGFVRCLTGDAPKGLATMQSVMSALEKHVEVAVLLGDPNYISSTYDLMSQIAAVHGMQSERLEYGNRSEPSYYRGLVKTGRSQDTIRQLG